MVWEEQDIEDDGFDGQLEARAVRNKEGTFDLEMDLPPDLPTWIDAKALRRRAEKIVSGMSKSQAANLVNNRLAEVIREELLRQRATAAAS